MGGSFWGRTGPGRSVRSCSRSWGRPERSRGRLTTSCRGVITCHSGRDLQTVGMCLIRRTRERPAPVAGVSRVVTPLSSDAGVPSARRARTSRPESVRWRWRSKRSSIPVTESHAVRWCTGPVVLHDRSYSWRTRRSSCSCVRSAEARACMASPTNLTLMWSVSISRDGSPLRCQARAAALGIRTEPWRESSPDRTSRCNWDRFNPPAWGREVCPFGDTACPEASSPITSRSVPIYCDRLPGNTGMPMVRSAHARGRTRCPIAADSTPDVASVCWLLGIMLTDMCRSVSGVGPVLGPGGRGRNAGRRVAPVRVPRSERDGVRAARPTALLAAGIASLSDQCRRRQPSFWGAATTCRLGTRRARGIELD